MSILKKIVSVFGSKKDESKSKETSKKNRRSSFKKEKQQHSSVVEEWSPGKGAKKKKTTRKPAVKKSTKQKRASKPAHKKPSNYDERLAQFRPEEEDRKQAYIKRHAERKETPSASPKKRTSAPKKPAASPKKKKAPPAPRPPKKKRPPVDDSPWELSEFAIEPQEGKIRFHDLGLHKKLMRSIQALGWEYATPIQGEILPNTLKGKDMAGRAQTGTGKTAAFLISIINHCLNKPLQKHSPRSPRALIIAPTRELAMQIGEDSEGLNRFTGLQTVVLYGGMDYNKQERDLDDKIDIVVATPGRLLDFASKGIVNLRFVEIMVIDEADRMLDMGFIPDVRRIIYKTPSKENRQTVLFSATLSDEVMRLAAAWMVNPERIDIEPEQVAVDTVDQKVFIVTDNEKFPLLYNIIKNDSPDRIIIFANRRDQTERLANELDRYSIECEMLSGAVTQKKRMRILDDFKAGKVKVLVATDVAGRGIHVDGVSHVVNFNIPENPDDYVHRIGRTGRAGATGKSITFACEMESFELPKIEELLGMELKCTMPPENLLQELPPAPPRKKNARHRTSGSGDRRPPRKGPPRRSNSNNRSR